MSRPRWGVLPADLYADVIHVNMNRHGGHVWWFGVGSLVIFWRRRA